MQTLSLSINRRTFVVSPKFDEGSNHVRRHPSILRQAQDSGRTGLISKADGIYAY